eukprot:gene3594-biopygen8235
MHVRCATALLQGDQISWRHASPWETVSIPGQHGMHGQCLWNLHGDHDKSREICTGNTGNTGNTGWMYGQCLCNLHGKPLNITIPQGEMAADADRTRIGRGAHDRIRRNGHGPDADRTAGVADSGAGVARAWRGRGAGYGPFLAWVARAWRGHVL